MSVSADEVNTFLDGEFPGTGNRCTEIGEGYAVAEFRVEPDRLRPGGYVSGPTQFGVADAALWYALFGTVGLEPMALTSELSIRFLRPAQGEVLRGRADLHQVGRRQVVGTVVLWMDDRRDKPVAVAQGTYVRPRS